MAGSCNADGTYKLPTCKLKDCGDYGHYGSWCPSTSAAGNKCELIEKAEWIFGELEPYEVCAKKK